MGLTFGGPTASYNSEKPILKIEAGKKYLCRDGSIIVEVIRVLTTKNIIARNNYPVLGLLFESETDADAKWWAEDGTYIIGSREVQPLDLVAEYKEPEYVYFNLYDDLDGLGSRSVGRDTLEQCKKTAVDYLTARIRMDKATGKVEQLDLETDKVIS